MTIKVLIFLDTILCILSVCACACGETELNSDFCATLNIDFKKESCKDMFLTLLEGEQARIITEPFYINHVFYNNTPWDKHELKHSENFNKYEVFLNDTSPGKKNVTFLTNKGNVDLADTVNYLGDIYTPMYCEPTFHVRMKKTPLTVAINDIKLKTERTNLSVTDYDAVAYYKFREGELADISCGINDEIGKISLRYREMETTTSRPNQLITDYALRLQVKLKSQDSGQYLTCRINTTTDYAIVRVYLLSDGESNDDLIVRVNGLKLRPQLTTGANAGDGQVISFLYKYKLGESVKVVCEKREGLAGSLVFNSEGVEEVTCENDNAYCTAEKKLLKEDDLDLDCDYSYTNGNKLTANIRLSYDDMQDFYLLGIPPDRLKYQYKQTITNDVPTIISEYEYSDGETLNLTCMKNIVNHMVYALQWETEEKSKDKALGLLESKPIERSFNFSSDSDNKVLKCIVYKGENDRNGGTAKKYEKYLTIALNLTMRKPADKTTETPSVPDDPNPHGDDDDEKGNGSNLILYGIGGGLCLLILVMALLVYSVSKRKTPRKRDSNINYENLPHNADSTNTIPNPSQWNEEEYARPVDLREDTDTYSVPYNQKDVDAIYAKPQPKILRNKTKTKETDKNVNIEPTYSEVGNFVVKDCNDSNYAQVLPKTLRNNLKGPDKNFYANTTDSPNYAEVIPKSLRKNEKIYVNKNYVLPKDSSNYAEIAAGALRNPDNSTNYVNLNNESPYAEVVHSINNRNKYVNVFPNNEPYANASSSDYAEPAYCELNVKNNKK